MFARGKLPLFQALRSVFVTVIFALASSHAVFAAAENVFIITLDGLRWQELFTGAEEALISKSAGVSDTNRLGRDFWRPSAEERRSALFPFFWNTVARQGQIFGNQNLGSTVRVTNGKNFTYPGFNEILTGFADKRIDSNSKTLNPNVTVMEWLHRKPEFADRVAAFANWDVFPYILNAGRAGIPIWTGYPEGTLPDVTPGMKKNMALAREITPLWDGMNFDVFFYHAALEYMLEKQPRVVWIAFSETDEWAHEGRYDLYLRAAHRIDSYIEGLWNAAQSHPAYKDKTAFIITTDHGRGSGPEAWRHHGANVDGAEDIWIAAIGPDMKPLGERKSTPLLGQNQVAATAAAMLGEDYNASVEKAGVPIADLLEKN